MKLVQPTISDGYGWSVLYSKKRGYYVSSDPAILAPRSTEERPVVMARGSYAAMQVERQVRVDRVNGARSLRGWLLFLAGVAGLSYWAAT